MEYNFLSNRKHFTTKSRALTHKSHALQCQIARGNRYFNVNHLKNIHTAYNRCDFVNNLKNDIYDFIISIR